MAEAAALTKAKLLAGKLVQYIAEEGDHVPEEYHHKNGFPEATDAPDLWRDTLLIDYSLLHSFSTSELAKLRTALSEWGCFQLINHGIENSILEELIEVSKQFFSLPLEEKLKCSSADDIIQGYGSDFVYSGPSQSPTNWNDRLFLKLYPKEKFMIQCWPQNPKNFRQMVDEYAKKLREVNEVICKAMAKSLSLEENCLNFGKQGPKIARFNLYPRCPCPERVLGTKGHADSTLVTYLLPENNVEGLQILKDDQWYKVLRIPGTLFINFGDIGEVMTNGVFKSAVHRVTSNSLKDRTSVVIFFMPDNDDVIEPLSEMVDVLHPPLYKKFSLSEYMLNFLESFKQGSRALDAFKV